MLVLVVGTAVVLWRLSASEPYVVRPGGPEVARAQPAAATRVLADLVDAVDRRDPDAAAALAAPDDEDAAGLLREVVANAADLDVTDLALRYVDERGAVADGAWQAAVEVSWSFAGVDPGVASTEVQVGFASVADSDDPGGPDAGVVLTGLGGGGLRTPLWLSGPLEVLRGPGVLVATAGDAAGAGVLLERATEAVTVVGRVLPAWTGPLVVEAPGSEQQLEAALDGEPGDFANVAAVTATVDGSTRDDAPLHVFVNPAVYDALDPVGGQVVVSHEATHVATLAPLRTLPVWLLEGFADYVALRDVALPLTTTAGQVIAEVRADGPPDALPDQADFDATSDRFGAAYEAAWLACVELADLAGQRALVATYEAVSDGASLDEALAQQASLGVARLTRDWRERLQELAR